MPTLISQTSDRFNERTNTALARSGTVHSQNPFARVFTGSVPPPNLPTPTNLTLNMRESAIRPNARNIGNSSDIVMDPEVFTQAVNRMDTVVDFVGAESYAMINGMEEICTTIFQIPETVSRIQNVCDTLKRCLSSIRGVTEAVATDTRQFISDMADIDRGNTRLIAVSQSGASNTIQSARSTITRQASNMERTSTTYKSRAARLEQEAEREERRAASLQIQIDAAMTRLDI